MWIVKKIGFITQRGETVYDFFQFMSSPVLHCTSTVVHIVNSETGDIEVLYSRDGLKYIQKLREFSPYGFIDNNVGSNVVDEENVLAVVDDLSMQFLSYIDSVEEVRINRSDDNYEFISSLPGSFTGLDDDITLLVCDTVERCACTLFYAICFCPDGWLGDVFYLYSRKDLDWVGLGMDTVEIAYKVKFCDVVGAKRLLTKAVAMGINPVRDFAKSDFF